MRGYFVRAIYFSFAEDIHNNWILWKHSRSLQSSKISHFVAKSKNKIFGSIFGSLLKIGNFENITQTEI
jgi:hypothetical protein